MSRFNENGKNISFTFNNVSYKAKEGDSITSALFSNEILINRKTYNKSPRGSFCCMGVCFECLVKVDGINGVQACKRKIIDGMEIYEDE